MRPQIRLTVMKEKPPLKSPHYETAVERVVAMHSVRGKGENGVVTTAEDRSSTTRKALQGLMDWLVTEKGLTRAEAYMLISMARNLHELGLPAILCRRAYRWEPSRQFEIVLLSGIQTSLG